MNTPRPPARPLEKRPPARSGGRAAGTQRRGAPTTSGQTSGQKSATKPGQRSAQGSGPRKGPQHKPTPPVMRWVPAMAAIGVLAVVVFAGGIGSTQGAGSASDSPTSVTGVDVATSTSALTGSDGSSLAETGFTVPASTMPALGTGATITPTVKTVIDRNLFNGLFGDDVKALQARLTELGFAPGVADGAFGSQTQQAVWAFEKLVLGTASDKASGKVTNEMWQRMQDPIVIQPRRTGSGTHVEIYLPQQVAAVFTENKATLVIHISSGTALTSERTPENSWCEPVTLDTDAQGNVLDPPETKEVCGVSFTPGGVFRFKRQVTGDRVGALGRMFNPIYFNYGIAMHGAKEVPLHPASHGCIRMHRTISDTFQSYVNLRDVVYVWGQDGREPESYTKKETYPVFNYPDPSATTTTVAKTTTTTAKVTTTTAKASTAPSEPKVTTTTTRATTPPATTPPVTATPTTVAQTTPPATTPPIDTPTTPAK